MTFLIDLAREKPKSLKFLMNNSIMANNELTAAKKSAKKKSVKDLPVSKGIERKQSWEIVRMNM